MPDRSYARYIAPLALVAVLVAAIVVVSSTGKDSSSKTNSAATTSKTGAKSGRTKRFYRVKPGDLLSEISQRTGVDVAVIIKLNPNVDPQALQAGQLIRIRK